jgi:hypothetical protein
MSNAHSERLPRKPFWFALLAGAAILLVIGWHILYAQSVDLALHYALANALFTELGTGNISREYLGVMAVYPSGAHWLAALLSLVTQSPLVSIVLLTEISAYAAYVVIALFLIDSGTRASVIRLGLMICTIRVLASQQAAFGYQVIGNYFYPQLLGESLVLVALYALSRCFFWTLLIRYQCVLLFAATWLLGWIQPLAAVEFCGAFVTFMICLALLRLMRQGLGSSRTLVGPAVLSVGVILGVVANPAFTTMVSLAANNGALRFGTVVSSGGYFVLVAFATITAAFAIRGAITGRLQERRAMLLGSATLASAILLVMQKCAHRFLDLGSDYAVSKYVFLLATLACTTFLYVFVRFPRPSNRTSGASPESSLPLRLSPPVFALCSIFAVVANARMLSQDLRPILRYQGYADHLRRHSLPLDASENIVSLNKSFTPVTNLIVSFGDLGLPWDVAKYSITPNGAFADVPVKYAIVSTQSVGSADLASCAVGAAPSLPYAIVDKACYLGATSSILMKPQ